MGRIWVSLLYDPNPNRSKNIIYFHVWPLYSHIEQYCLNQVFLRNKTYIGKRGSVRRLSRSSSIGRSYK